MSIEQHAEAAVQKLAIDNCWDVEADLSSVREIVQSAIDEATALLRARVEALEGLGPLIEEYGDARANFVSTYCPETYEECDMWSKKSLETRAKITAILKWGGA